MKVTLNITRRCNKDCTYCYLPKEDVNLSFDKIKEIIENNKIELITLTGGEPLMHPEIEKILKYLATKNLKIRLFTNGILLKGKLLSVLKDTNTKVYITIPYGPARANILEANKRGIEVAAHVVLFKQTLNLLDSLFKKFPFIKEFLFLYPVGTKLNKISMYNPEEWFSIVTRARSIIEQNGIKGYFELSFIKKQFGIAKESPCHSNGEYLYADAEGLFYPCCLMADYLRGSTKLDPIKYSSSKCPFLKKNALPSESKFLRICPLVFEDKEKGLCFASSL